METCNENQISLYFSQITYFPVRILAQENIAFIAENGVAVQLQVGF